MDFERWQSTNRSEVLWLSGPAECRISDASSHIVGLVKENASQEQRLVLYFFCATAPPEDSIANTFVSTILHQLIRSLPLGDLKKAATNAFLRTLLEVIPGGEPRSNRDLSRFKLDDSLAETIEKILQTSSNGYWRALRAVTDLVHEHGLYLMIDGLDKIEHQKSEFVVEIHTFIEHLRERPSTTRVLLTSRPQAEIKEILSGVRCIEYDKERKGSIISHS